MPREDKDAALLRAAKRVVVWARNMVLRIVDVCALAVVVRTARHVEMKKRRRR